MKFRKNQKLLKIRNNQENQEVLDRLVISMVKVFKKWVKLQGQGHRVKNNGTHGKVLSQGILM